MRVLIVDQCCKRKEHPEGSKSFSADEIDASSREELLDREDVHSVPASDLYAGRQQKAIDRAVATLRAAGHTVTRVFISAGFGVAGETEPLPPYDVTFSGMSANDIRDRADRLSITADLIDAIHDAPGPDIAFFPLGADYFSAIDVDTVISALPEETLQVLYNHEERASASSKVISLPARNANASEYGVNAIELKGHYIERFASRIESEVDDRPLSPERIQLLCTETESTQSSLDIF